VRLGIVGVELGRLAKMARSGIEASERALHQAQIVVAIRDRGIERDRASDQVGGLLAAAGLMREDAEVVKTADMDGSSERVLR